MSTALKIPDWQQQLRRIRELRAAASISDADWQSLADWLVDTRFDETSFVAGEATALLLSEQAPDQIKCDVLERTAEADGWSLYWRLFIQDASDPDRIHTVELCQQSPIALIRIRGIQQSTESQATGASRPDNRQATPCQGMITPVIDIPQVRSTKRSVAKELQ